MKRFKKFIGKNLNTENIKNSDELNLLGIKGKYIPDPPEEFDEFEFTTDFEGQEIQINVAVQSEEIKRIFFSLVDEHNKDIVKGLTETKLEELLKEKGDLLLKFFEYITF